MAISAKDVAALRKRTGLGMMDCKKALEQTDGDFEAAVELLRESVKGKMDERTGRDASEGLVRVAEGDGAAAIIELVCETDFVSRGEAFAQAADKIVQMVLEGPEGEVEIDEKYTAITDELRIQIQENISLRRAIKLTGEKIGTYVHHNSKNGAVIVAEGPIDTEMLTGLCQHVVAHVPPPLAVDESGLDAAAIEEQRKAAMAEAEASGKPAEIAEKIATGKLKKWIDEQTLLGQDYVRDMDSRKPVREHLPKDVKIVNFVRCALGG